MIDCIVQDLLKYPDEGAESKVTVKQLVPGPNKDYRWVKQLVPGPNKDYRWVKQLVPGPNKDYRWL
jgi:hypothetical protein